MEYEDDFKEYVSVPHFSYKIIQTLYDLTNSSGTENFAYVYSTYSSLKTSNETKDPKEMVTALLDAELACISGHHGSYGKISSKD